MDGRILHVKRFEVTLLNASSGAPLPVVEHQHPAMDLVEEPVVQSRSQ